MRKKIIIILALIFMVFFIVKSLDQEGKTDPSPSVQDYSEEDIESIYLAGGCFWGIEEYMDRIDGVVDAISGYANGNTQNPSYEDVIYKNTGHAETVLVKYDPEIIELKELLLYYFKVIDPVALNKQGNDVGTQYRTGIYYLNEEQKDVAKSLVDLKQKEYNNPILVEILALDNFYEAEDYHQDYLKKNPQGYCTIDLSQGEEAFDLEASLYFKPADENLKEILSDEEYKVTQENATEKAFSHPYNQLFEKGIYLDSVTGQPLFTSKDKYDAGTGWPTFTKPISNELIKEIEDKSLGMRRIEVRSVRGDTHLGHVFNDGPFESGGKRYCINGSALRFIAFRDMKNETYEEYIKLFE